MTLIPLHEAFEEELQDPEFTTAYLNESLEEDGMSGFLVALRNIARANGGIAKVAEIADVNRENLFRSLSHEGNPKLGTLLPVLKALG